MSTRVEFIEADMAGLDLTKAKRFFKEHGETSKPRPDTYVLSIAGDEVTAIVGSLTELSLLGSRIRSLVATERTARLIAEGSRSG